MRYWVSGDIMEKKLKILCICTILLAIAVMMLPGTYIGKWMSPPDEQWISLHSYLDIGLLGVSAYFPAITAFTAILSVLCQVIFKKINKLVIALTITSLSASVFSILTSYSIDEELPLMIIDGPINHVDISFIGGVIITGLLCLSFFCQIIYITHRRKHIK